MQAAAALLLDLCNVVYDDTMWSRCLFQLVKRMGPDPTFDSFWSRWLNQYHPDVASGRCEFSEALQRFLASWELSRGQIDETCAAVRSRRRQFDNAVRPLPGVKATIAQLDALGWKIGVLGHVPASGHDVRQCLNRLGLAAHVDVVLSTCELYRTQPDACCYELAARALNTPAEQTLFVSADPYAIAQAARAGMQTVTLQDSRWHTGTQIEQLGDLLPLLRSASAHRLAG